MKEISIEVVKSLQLEILRCIDEFCSKRGINYSLSSGTLIGAVRHNGYIPWDDDIDIMMSRSDYQQFITSFNGAFEHLTLLSPEIDANFYAPYANVFDNRTLLTEGTNGHLGKKIGVKIDIFPIDSVSVDNKVYTEAMKKVDKLNYIMYVKRLENLFQSGARLALITKIYIRKLIYCLIPYSYLQRKIKDIATDSLNTNSDYVDNVVFNIYSKKCTRFHKSIMNSYIKLPFENYHFSVIKDYDTVLRKMYGDYMQLPPVEQRVPHHNFKAYWID